MENTILLYPDDDGIFHEYNDEFDLTIHFENQKDRDTFIEKVKKLYEEVSDE